MRRRQFSCHSSCMLAGPQKYLDLAPARNHLILPGRRIDVPIALPARGCVNVRSPLHVLIQGTTAAS